ncbi:MAG: cupin domain-containing protein [Burkholderiales bacterium]|nr:cupin domain-containing protein [Burkholderiales bacterium]
MRKPGKRAAASTPARGPAPDAASAATLGATIRKARQHHHRTLQQVAHAADISVSSLSQIERNLLTPSVATLKRIADALGIPAGKLMFAADARSTRASVAVLRKGHRKSVAFPDSAIRYELLTPDLRRRASLLWLVASPGAESGAALTHEGEDVVVVLKGRLSIEVGGQWHDLEAGDSIYFSSELPHRWCNRDARDAEALWMSSPPSF